jgi:hypothetical protein
LPTGTAGFFSASMKIIKDRIEIMVEARTVSFAGFANFLDNWIIGHFFTS